MTDLTDILASAADHEKGRWFELHDPVDGAPTGMKLKIAGPDSETQRKAQLALADELAEMADIDGRVSAENREKARLNALARMILDWQVTEDGEALPCTHRNAVRLLRAGAWVQQQVDAFASDRAAYRDGEAA